jgi:hypothetical protein
MGCSRDTLLILTPLELLIVVDLIMMPSKNKEQHDGIRAMIQQ